MDKRLHSRVAVETQCKARFQLGGQTYNNITVRNLGADGCCIQMPAKYVTGLQERSTLDGWELIHPSLPKGTIKARVVWIHGQDQPRTEYHRDRGPVHGRAVRLQQGPGPVRDTLVQSNPSIFIDP